MWACNKILRIVLGLGPWSLLTVLALYLSGCVAMSSTDVYGQFSRPDVDIARWQQGPEAQRGMILLCEQLDPAVAAEVTAKIIALDRSPSSDRIRLIINCPGGEVSAWRMIHNAMRMTSKPVDVINAGNCYSAACAVLASATGRRLAFANSHFMIHKPRIVGGHLGGQDGQVLDFEVEAFQAIIRQRTSLPQDWFPLTNRPVYLDAAQALRHGLIDGIIEDLP